MVLVAKQKKTETAFGRRLRVLRETKALTQAALGELAGMQASAIARLEASDREPTWPTVLKIAEALGVEPNDFLDADEDAPPEKPAPKKPKK